MQLHTIKPHTPHKKHAPVGRGGRRGKTSGRGSKGQKARAGHKIRPEMRDLIKKLPKRRGYGKNRSRTVRSNRIVYAAVTLSQLEKSFANGETVSPATLLEKKMVKRVRGNAPRVKILGKEAFSKQITVRHCILSEPARAALVASGSTIHA